MASSDCLMLSRLSDEACTLPKAAGPNRANNCSMAWISGDRRCRDFRCVQRCRRQGPAQQHSRQDHAPQQRHWGHALPQRRHRPLARVPLRDAPPPVSARIGRSCSGRSPSRRPPLRRLGALRPWSDHQGPGEEACETSDWWRPHQCGRSSSSRDRRIWWCCCAWPWIQAPCPPMRPLGAELGMTASEAHPCSAVPATASRHRRAVLPVVLPAALHPFPSARGSSRATSHHRRGRGRCVVARSSDVTRPPGITPMLQPADPSASLESSRKVSFSNTTSENDCSSAVRRWGSKI